MAIQHASHLNLYTYNLVPRDALDLDLDLLVRVLRPEELLPVVIC